MGQLTLIIGPMFSGKSTELLRQVKRYKIANKRCLVINHSKDTRYGTGKIITHDHEEFPSTCVSDLTTLNDEVVLADVVAIDEAQFFSDLSICKVWAMDKILLVSGLVGDFKKEAFGHMHELLPQADEIIPLKAICNICYKDATFTRRIPQEREPFSEEQEVVGGSDKYQAVCRDHHSY